MIVNKTDLIAQVADSTGKIIDAVLESIQRALTANEELRLIGFGTFAVSERKAKEGRNPQTGAKIQIKASKQPKFKPHTALKEAVDQ
jgi:DNA-binding protein HU-beta